MTRVAIVGSRDFLDYDLLEKNVDQIIAQRKFTDITIVSGGARGADTLAEQYATKKSYKMKVYPANWDKYGKSAGPIRNEQIVLDSDIIIAFKRSYSRGTENTIRQARDRSVETIVIDV